MVSITPSCWSVVMMAVLQTLPVLLILTFRLPSRITGSARCCQYSSSKQSSSLLGLVLGVRYVPSRSQCLLPVTRVALIELGDSALMPSSIQWCWPILQARATLPWEGLVALVTKIWKPCPHCACCLCISLASVRSTMSIFRLAIVQSALSSWVSCAEMTL